MHMHSKLGDAYNKHYSGFVYHPEHFRMDTNCLQYMDLSASTTCVDHVRMHDLIQGRKDHRPECYIHSRCTQRNDQLPIMGINDDNRQKIPQSNCSMRHTVMATSTLRYLTLFSMKHSSELKLRSTIFSLSGYELSDRRWNNRLSINMRGQVKNMILDKSIPVFNNKMRNLLFHIEFLIDNGACLIHEGNRAPGRCVKNNLIHREMVKETSDNLRALTGGCHNNHNKHNLTFGDVMKMICIIEHDRMLYNGCDLLFSDDQVDEFEFVQSCKNIGWTVFPTVNNCLMIGGL